MFPLLQKKMGNFPEREDAHLPKLNSTYGNPPLSENNHQKPYTQRRLIEPYHMKLTKAIQINKKLPESPS